MGLNMEIGKLKNVAIILLALVNISFASIIATDRIREARLQAAERRGLAAALERLGVSISESSIPCAEDLYIYDVFRDKDKEALAAGRLLGATEAEELGGNIFLYKSAKGEAQFRGGGNFEITLYETSLSDSAIVKVLEPQATAASENVFVCAFKGKPVFNCRITVTRLPTGETVATGSRLPGTPQNEARADALGPATLLLSFADEMSSRGIIIRRIERISAGYLLADTASRLQLKPVWRLETDGGVYYMDAVEGKLTSGPR